MTVLPILNSAYPHDGSADKDSYWQDSQADKRRYWHDRIMRCFSELYHVLFCTLWQVFRF